MSVILDVNALKDVNLPNSFECVVVAHIDSNTEQRIEYRCSSQFIEVCQELRASGIIKIIVRY